MGDGEVAWLEVALAAAGRRVHGVLGGGMHFCRLWKVTSRFEGHEV